MVNGHSWSLRWALLDGLSTLVKTIGIYRISRHTPCSVPSWSTSSNPVLSLWTLGISPQLGFHMCPHGFPTWCSLPPWGVHISEVASDSPSCIICHHRACRELLLVVRCQLPSLPWASHRSLDRWWWDPSMMVLVSTLLFFIIAWYWVQLGTLQTLYPAVLNPLSKPTLPMHRCSHSWIAR